MVAWRTGTKSFPLTVERETGRVRIRVCALLISGQGIKIEEEAEPPDDSSLIVLLDGPAAAHIYMSHPLFVLIHHFPLLPRRAESRPEVERRRREKRFSEGAAGLL